MARPKKDGQFFTCYLRKDILERLTVYSDDTGIPKTFVVEKALQKYLDEILGVKPKKQAKKIKPL